MKNQSLIQKSIPKIKKLSTGVNCGSPHVVKYSSPRNNKSFEKKRAPDCAHTHAREKSALKFPALKAGKESTPETTQTFPTFFCGGVKEEKNANAGVGFVLVDILLCKNGKVNRRPKFSFLKGKEKWEAIM